MNPVLEDNDVKLVRNQYGPSWNRVRAAVLRQPLVTTSTAKGRPRPVKRRRPEWRLARWIRCRQLVVFVPLMLVMPGVIVWSEKSLIHIHVKEPVNWDMRLAARATMDIKELLDVIGHGVTVSSVESRAYERNFAAAYNVAERRVKVESDNEFSDETLLYVMGHECAHAMFRQGNFLEHDPNIARYQYLVREVAADVVGAHLAGKVVSRRGKDGWALTDNLVEEIRIMSRSYAIEPSAIKEQISTDWDGNARTYLGNGDYLMPRTRAEPLINAIDQICREHDDLWEAVRTIASELHNVDAKSAKEYPAPDDWRPGR